MTKRNRGTALDAFVLLVIALGAFTLFGALARISVNAPLFRNGVVFWLFVGLFALGEARPLEWHSGAQRGAVTASWTFSIGLLCVAPLGVSLGVVALISAVLELRLRRLTRRVAFNVGQVTLSLFAASLVLRLFNTKEELWTVAGPSYRWVLSLVCAGLAAIFVNTTLTCTAFALGMRKPFTVVVREALTSDWAVDLLLVAMAPVLTVMAVRSIAVIPMLLAVIGGIYVSAKSGLNHRYEASHDLLTGLPNRRMFYEQAELALSAARNRGRSVGIVVIDLNGFKEINDRLGHAIGDRTLKHVASRLDAWCKPSDVIARLGGDEFAILLSNRSTEAAVELDIATLQESLSETLDVDGIPLVVSGSIGLAHYPRHGEDIDTLLGHADSAMYFAKSRKLGMQVYSGEAERNGPTRLAVLGELRLALATDDQLFLMYQPKIDLRTGEMSGVEALIRWQHPERGLLAAAFFMGIVEQTELIDSLTTLVLRQAVQQLAVWRERGIFLPIAVNISARSLANYRFADFVRSILDEFGVPADSLEFEITENTVTADPIRAEVVLGTLKALGIHISVDDFGTGYSSLAHLRSLQLDAVKIDRSFVKDICTSHGDRVIVRCIIDLATNLDLTTVAEGVEDGATLDILREMGCTYAQGYFLGHPGSSDEVEKQLLRRPQAPQHLPLRVSS